jgi:atypical dual specificity phosphatase
LADLARESRQRLLVVVTHNQAHARRLAGQVLLLFDGKIVEQRSTRDFFAAPRTKAARDFVKTGGCVRPARSELPSPWETEIPSGFFWLKEQELAGLPRPGLLRDIEADLGALVQLGICTLVGLEETQTVPAEALAAHGIAHLHFPVVDMGAPQVPDTFDLCQRVASLHRANRAVAFHCRGGLGRTGTLLAAQLLYGGDRFSEAVRRVRACNPLCIQSEPQLEFLAAFSAALERHRAHRGFA